MKTNAKVLREKALKLIEADLAHIESISNSKLEHETAQDLVRYANFLDDLAKDIDKKRGMEEDEVQKLSTAQLTERLKEILNEP
jgi:hypothetical protein